MARAPVSSTPSTRVEQRADIDDLRRAGKDQRQRAGGVRSRTQNALADTLRRKLALGQMGAADDAHDGLFRWHFAVLACDSGSGFSTSGGARGGFGVQASVAKIPLRLGQRKVGNM